MYDVTASVVIIGANRPFFLLVQGGASEALRAYWLSGVTNAH